MLSPTERTLTQLICAAFPLDGVTVAAPRIAPAEWMDIAQTAQQHNLASLLYAALCEIDVAEPPAAAIQPLHESYYRTKVANWIALSEVSELLSVFARTQIPSLLLKGAALAKLVYPIAALRPMSDVDILIERADITRVSEILLSRGFAKCSEPADGFHTQLSYNQPFIRGGQRRLTIEMHWHLLGLPFYRERIPIEWFWRRTMPLQIDEQNAMAFAPEAQIIHLAAHAVLQHQGHNLLAAYDLALVLARYRDQIDWEDVIQSARAFGLSRVLQSNLARAQDAWGVRIPAKVSARLQRAIGIRENFLYAILTTPRIQARMLWDGMNLPGFGSKLRYFKSILFPTREHMQKRYGLAGSRAVFIHKVRRLGRGVRLFVRSAAAMAGNVAKEWLRVGK